MACKGIALIHGSKLIAGKIHDTNLPRGGPDHFLGFQCSPWILQGSEQNDRLWYSALFIGGIQHLQDPGLSLLKWRLKTCPKAAKDAAFALENSSLKFAKELDSLHSNLMASKGIHPEILVSLHLPLSSFFIDDNQLLWMTLWVQK